MTGKLTCIWLCLSVFLFLNDKVAGQKSLIYFEENKGQWNDTIRYRAAIGSSGSMFLTDRGFVYHFLNENDLSVTGNEQCTERSKATNKIDPSTPLRHYAYKVNFSGSQEGEALYEGKDAQLVYHNYFLGNDSSRWVSNVNLFRKIIQKDIYPGIDMAIYGEGESIKYDFIVHPGIDPGQIMLEYDGVAPILSPSGDLIIKTSLHTIIEQAPVVYQEIEGQRVIIPSRYELSFNQLSYKILTDYDTTAPLIIDPTLVFSTYSGGNSYSNLAYASTYDGAGNFYSAAFVAFVGWPVTTGAFQTSYSGEHDIGINKYSADGSTLLYSTYIGGSGDDRCVSMMVNASDELILAAISDSDDMPLLANSFQGTYAGNADIYLAMLNSSGTSLLGATYFGSAESEGFDTHIPGYFISPVEIGLASDGSIWLASNSTSSESTDINSLIPVTPFAIQTSPEGGRSEGVIVQFSSDLSALLFSSYIGGDSLDICTSLVINEEGNVVVSGMTNSLNFPTTSSGINPSYMGGSMDGFVLVINANTYELMHSTYLGTDAEDMAFYLQTDEHSNVVVMGRTMGDYAVSPNVYAASYYGDTFIDKLSPDLSHSIYSTRLGNRQSLDVRFKPKAFLYDYCGRTYITAYDGKFQAITNDALKNDAGNPFVDGIWIGILEAGFSDLLFGSYYGTEMDHPHAAISRFDPKGAIYQNVCSASPYYPVTSNAVFPFDQNGHVDAISFKIDLQAEFVRSDAALFNHQSDTGCAPYTVQFQNNTYSPFPVEYTWDFGDGTPIDTNANPTHTFVAPGVYQVVLKAYSPETCNMEDYDTVTIAVFHSEGPDIFIMQDTAICTELETLELWVGIHNFSSSMVIEWLPASGIMGLNTTDTITVLAGANSRYTVRVQDTSRFCAVSTDSVTITYAPRTLALLNRDTILCQGDTLHIHAIGSEGYKYRWLPVTGVSDSSALEPYIVAAESLTYLLTATHPDCKDTSQSIVLTVDTPYQAKFIIEPEEVCVGHPIYLYPESDHSTAHFSWIFEQQSREKAKIRAQYQHAFDFPGWYPITLYAQFRACPDTRFTDSIMVLPLPEIDLGNDTSICLHGAPVHLRNLRSAPLNSHHHLWNTGDTTPALKVVHPGTYTLSITAEPIGCTATESIEISKDCYIDVPNAFTPNADGHNDYFFPRRLLSEGVSSFKMQVFNRWGQIVFETANLNGRGWDGRFNEREQPLGVYLYRIQVDFTSGHQESYEGNVTLLR